MMKYFLDFKDFCQIFADFRLNLCAFVSSCFINNISHAEWMEYAEENIKLRSLPNSVWANLKKYLELSFFLFIFVPS